MGRNLVFIVALVLLQAILALGKDYYEILNVPKGANDAQIKRSYRKLALKYHPDKVTGSDEEKASASKKFADINHAYEVLSDSEKRRIYDQHGEAGLKQHQAQQGGGGGQQDIFSFFFGGQQRQEEQTPKGHDVLIDLPVTLKDLFLGREFKVIRDKSVVKPAPGTRQCKCKMKIETKPLGPGMFQQFHTQVCEQCDNVKLGREREEVTVHVEPGMVDGHQITFFEEGEPLIDGETGDLKFVLRTRPDARWERRGNDLYINETISLVDALVGFSKEIEHLDGHKVTLSNQAVTKPREVQRIEGEGMPVHDTNSRGALWVTYSVAFPAQLSEVQKNAAREHFGGAAAAA